MLTDDKSVMVNKRGPSARPYRAELSAALDVSSRFLRPVQITADVMLGLTKHVIVNRISFWDRSQSSTRGSGMAKRTRKRKKNGKGDSSRLANRTAVSDLTTRLCIVFFQALV